MKKMNLQKTAIDREKFFELVKNRNWKTIIDLIKNNETLNLLSSDPITRSFIDDHLINELLSDYSVVNKLTYKYFLEDFYLLHVNKKNMFFLNDENYKKLILRIVEIEENKESRYRYAKIFPKEEICKKAIDMYEAEKNKILSHSQESEIIVTINDNIREKDATTSLFKSQQEYLFYKAVREVYPNFLVLPNVALNATLDFDVIKDSLSNEEKKYFFRALIDCVVVDTENDYKPTLFIELDSVYHDNDKQIKKDKNKDNILAKAGQKLIRVRRLSTKENDFVKLIRETLK